MSEPVKKPIKFDSEDVYAINVPNTIPQVILTDESVTEIPVPSEVKSETIEKDCDIVVPNVLPNEELIDPDRVQITIPQDLPIQTLSERTMDELNPGPIKSTKIEEGEKTLNPDFKFLEEGKVSYQGEKPRFLKDFLSNDFKRNSDNTISIARNLLSEDGEYSFVLNTDDKTHSSNFVKIRVTAGVPTMIVTGRFESEDIQGTFKAVTENIVQTLVGNLSGIVDELFGELTGKGLYSVNSYIKGIFEIRDGSIFKSNIYGDTSIDTIIGQINGIDNGLVELNELYELTNQELLAMQQSLLAIDELRNLVFDQEGYFDAEKIKPLSIETTMLSVGAKPQRLYTSCLFQANYEGDKNKFYATDGTLTHFLYPEPLREWAITGTTLTLPDDSFRYIYARCLKNGNTGGILLSQAQLLLEDGDYYNFLIGVLSSVIGGTSRIATATFGQTTINGRFITTGVIKSADGNTSFDLDTGVITGKITFGPNSTGYQNLADKPDLSIYAEATYVDAMLIDLQNQIDGQIISWFYQEDPTLLNLPAVEWDTELLKQQHANDTYTNTNSGASWKWVKIENVWQWSRITDTAAEAALALAAQAQDTADAKRRVFIVEPTTPYEVGDLWTLGTSGGFKRCIVTRLTGSFVSTDWEDATYFDNTQTVIEAGLITTGTIMLGDGTTIKAGITGQGTSENSVRIWAGDTFENRAVAPWRVMQNGNMVSAGWEFGADSIKKTGDISVELNSAMKFFSFLDGDDQKISIVGSNIKTLSELINPPATTLYPGANLSFNTTGITYDFCPNSLSLVTSKATLSIKVAFSGVGFVSFSITAKVYNSTKQYVLGEFPSTPLSATLYNGQSTTLSSTQNLYLDEGIYYIELKINKTFSSNGTLTVGGSNQNDNKVVYSASIQATSIGIDGMFSYWTNMKYFYLSQSDLNYFLRVKGNLSFISETNKASFSINDNNISLLGKMRNRQYEHYSVTSSTKVDIDFYSDIIFVTFSGNYNLALPKRSVILTKLGLTSSDNFAVKITIIGKVASVAGNVWGKNTSITGMNISDYPQIKNNNAGDISSLSVSQGDILEFVLVYDDSLYAAYVRNIRT